MQNTAQAKDRSTIVIENLKERYARVPRPVIKAKGLSFRAKCVYMCFRHFDFPALRNLIFSSFSAAVVDNEE